jgi:hypothetical protein
VRDTKFEGIRTAIATLVVVNCCWTLNQTLQTIEPLKKTNNSLKVVTDILESEVEPGSIVLSRNEIEQHLDFIGKWRLGTVGGQFRGPGMQAGLSRGNDRDTKRPGSVSPMQQKQRKSYYDRQGDFESDEFRTDLKKWAGNERKVYYVGTRGELDQLYEVASSIEIIETLDTEMPAMQGGMHPGGMALRGGGMGGLPMGEGMNPPGESGGVPGDGIWIDPEAQEMVLARINLD